MSAEIKNTAAGPASSSSADGSKGLSKIVNGWFETLPKATPSNIFLLIDLGKRFQTRATPQELVQKNIMRGIVMHRFSSICPLQSNKFDTFCPKSLRRGRNQWNVQLSCSTKEGFRG